MALNPLRALQEIARLPKYHAAIAQRPQTAFWRKLAYGPHKAQYSYVAIQEDPHAPVAMWFHGGGWQFGAPENLLAFGEYFWKRGYSVWMPCHRKLPRYSGEDLFSDAILVAQQVQQFYQVPPHLVLGGMSSGGHLASLLALRQNEWLTNGKVAGLLTAGAPLSLHQLGTSPTRWRLAGSSKSPRFEALNPVTHLTSIPNFPALIIHGTRDGLVPYPTAIAFVSQAKKIGWKALNFLSLPGANHTDSAFWVWE